MTFGQPNAQPSAQPMFAQPAAGTGDSISWEENKGALLMIKPTGTEETTTEYGETTVVVADIVVLDGPNEGTKYEQNWIFPKVLQSQTKKYINTGQIALGRLGQGEKKPGKSAPWMLQDFTPQDAELAQAYINKNSNDLPSY